MSVTRACTERRSRRHILLAQLLVWPLLATAGLPLQAHVQSTSGVKRLQHLQQRNSTLRQQNIREQQRQSSASTQRKSVQDSGLKRQLDDSDSAQHQQYQQHRQQTLRKHPDLPPPADVPVKPSPAPAQSSG